MSVSIDQVKKIAHLARIGINDEELQIFQQQLNGILNWIDQLQEIDTSSVNIYDIQKLSSLYERKDVVTACNNLDDVLKNAPQKKFNMFQVPKVIE